MHSYVIIISNKVNMISKNLRDRFPLFLISFSHVLCNTSYGRSAQHQLKLLLSLGGSNGDIFSAFEGSA